jgi:hypothetical protein
MERVSSRMNTTKAGDNCFDTIRHVLAVRNLVLAVSMHKYLSSESIDSEEWFVSTKRLLFILFTIYYL